MPSQTFAGSLDRSTANGGTSAIRYVRSWHIRDTTTGSPTGTLTTPDKVFLRDGTSTGNILATLVVTNGQDAKTQTFNPPLYFPNGVYINVAAGSITGSIDGV